MKENKRYTEVSLEGQAYERDYRNPKAGQYRYEYALYEVVTGLFKDVVCRSSRCVETLGLYFKDLPYGKAYVNEDENTGENEDESDDQKKKKTQNDIIEEMAALVERDVLGKVTFPMMHLCLAEAIVQTGADGSHAFKFTDGIYGFIVSIRNPGKDRGMRIDVQDMAPVRQEEADITEYRSARNAA